MAAPRMTDPGRGSPLSERVAALVVALAWTAARGFHEAVTMHQPGPRSHPWFGYYHRVDAAKMVLGAVLVAAVWSWRFDLGWIWAVGTSAAAWELFEITYWLGRAGALTLPTQENVLGTGWYLTGRALWALRVARWAVLLAALTYSLGGRL